MTFYDELEQVKAGIRIAQTGRDNDPKSYEKVTGEIGGVLLYGPYGIRADEWETFADQAGIKGARWQDRGAQEAVMDQQLTMAYNQYEGRWDGAVIAWRAGNEAARLVVTEGHPINSVIAGDGAVILQDYVNEVIPTESVGISPVESSSQAMSHGPFANASLVDRRPEKVRSKKDPGEAVTAMLTSMRDNQVRRGEVVTDGTTE